MCIRDSTKDWLGARARKRGGKGHGVLLGNAHIDEYLSMLSWSLDHREHPAAIRVRCV